jgi:thiol-disulfide isomerase/thioredoxin
MSIPAPRPRSRWLPLLAILVLVAPLLARADEPPFPKGAPWLNVSRPLNAADLRGHVVLLDFFTPGCINCIHVLPETDKLEREFGKRLLVIGVNSPKFEASRERANLEGFIARYAIRHPLVSDSGMVLWNHYNVFAWPTQVLLGPDGKVVGHYVGEGKYNAIRTDVIKTLKAAHAAGTLRNNALPLQAMSLAHHGLLQPGKVAVDAHYVAVSDSGHNRVLLFDRHGRLLLRVGDGRRGDRDGAAKTARFDGPQGLAFRGNTLYVADTGNSLIRAIKLPVGTVTTVAGNGEQDFVVDGDYGARKIGLNSPWGLELAGDTLYIAMAGDHQVWKFDLASDRIQPYAGSGDEGLADGWLPRSNFAQSSGLAYGKGLLYVADPESSSVRRVDIKSGKVETLIGRGLFTFGLRNGKAEQALLQHDQGLALIGDKLYIADTFNNAVRVLDLKSDTVSTLASGLKQPGGLAQLDDHTLLVADSNANRIVAVDTRSGEVHAWPLSGLK